jgi:hypothetical protein
MLEVYFRKALTLAKSDSTNFYISLVAIFIKANYNHYKRKRLMTFKLVLPRTYGT